MNCCSVLWFTWLISNHICALALSLASTATSLYLRRLFKKHLRAQIQKYLNFYSRLFYKNPFDALFWLFLIFYILKLKLHHFPLPPSNFSYLASLNLLSLSLPHLPSLQFPYCLLNSQLIIFNCWHMISGLTILHCIFFGKDKFSHFQYLFVSLSMFEIL